jgi:hypothetical protein
MVEEQGASVPFRSIIAFSFLIPQRQHQGSLAPEFIRDSDSSPIASLHRGISTTTRKKPDNIIVVNL